MTPSSRERLKQALHLIALFNLGVAEPLYSVLSKYAELFAFHHCTPLDVFVLTALFSLVFPGLLVLSASLAGMCKESLGQRIHHFWLAVLSGVFVLQIFKTFHEPPLPGPYLMALAMSAGILLMLAYHFFQPVRTYSSYLSIAIIACPLVFLFFSPVSDVLWPAKTSAATVSIKSRTPVVFLLFDEMPVMALMDKNHQIDPVRYPHWAALARESTWFRNDTTVNWETIVSVPAILSGRYPEGTGRKLPILKDYPNNLFTLLKGSYDENVLEFVTRLCPEDITGGWQRNESGLRRFQGVLSDACIICLHVLLPPDMTSPLPPVFHAGWDFAKAAPQHRNRNLPNEDEVLPDQLVRFQSYVDSINPVERPTLFFFHSKFPHHPFTFLPSGQQCEIINGSNDIEGYKIKNIEFGSDSWGVIQAHQREMLQIGLTDKLLGMFLDKLKTAGLYDKALIVVTTDHGASFRPNDQFRMLTDTNYQDILPTPLLIKRPFQHHGVVSDRNVESIDILPTIADVLGIRIPWDIDGRSVFDSSGPERDQKIFSDPTGNRRLVFPPKISAKYKTLDDMLAVFGSGTGFESLYRIGPYRELMGKSVKNYGPIHLSEAHLELESPWIYDDVNPEAAVVPVRIKGVINFPRDEKSQATLAIAINGMIQATTLTQEGGGTAQEFAAMVPPSSYHTGSNSVAIYAVSGSSRKPTLAVIESRRTLIYTLAANNTGEHITSSEGRTYQVLKKTLPGEVKVRVVHQTVEYRGWASGAQDNIPLERPVVFVQGKSFSPGWIWNLRAKIGALANSSAKRSVFRFVCLRSMVQEPYASAARIFVLTKDGTALELPIKD